MKIKKIIIIILIVFLIVNISRSINNYAVDFISDKKEKENGLLLGAEPYEIITNPETMVLLIHGTASSPKDFKDMAQMFAENNISSKAILLKGHGTNPDELSKTKYEEWVSQIQEELNNMSSKNKFILGYSLGGTLALDAAEKNDLSGIITINPPIKLKNKYIPYLPIINIVQKYHVSEPETIILIKGKDRAAYDVIPLKSVIEITKTVNQLQLEKITEPILMIQTYNDSIVNPISTNIINNAISSTEKEIIWLEVSTHTDPYEEEQTKSFEKAVEFIKKNSKL
jgi:carboxylesterase